MIGRDREILVTDVGQGNQQKRLRIGDQLGGYTLKTIQPSRVTLAVGLRRRGHPHLAVEKSGGGAPPAAAGMPRPGAPPRPGQPAAAPTSPAAGVQSPAAGIQPPRGPRAPTGRPARPGAPGAPGVPGMPGSPAAMADAAGAGGSARRLQAPPRRGDGRAEHPSPNVPAAVREKLEQLKGN